MGDDEDYSKLPLTERATHKVWKVRLAAYGDLAKRFLTCEDVEYAKFAPLVCKFVADSNAAAQGAGLDAALSFVENAPQAKGVAKEVTAGIVLKCVGAMKSATKEKAANVCLMLVEIEAGAEVTAELIKGFSQRNPKIIAGSANVLAALVAAFGHKPLDVKPILKNLAKLFAHADKNVRAAATTLTLELHKWLGDAVKNGLKDIKPVQLKDLEEAFAKESGKPKATRLIRSQQQADDTAGDDGGAAAAEGGPDDDGGDAGDDIDPYDLVDPVDVLAKMPKTFHEEVTAVKWSVRKDALSGLLTLASVPKIVGGDFGDIVKALDKVIKKDSNVLNVSFAAKCVAALANGLRKDFATYCGNLIPTCLAKFKEKKLNVVTALHEALSKMFPLLPLAKVLEDAIVALNDKNPEVKSQTAKFLAAGLKTCSAKTITKPVLKSIAPVLVTKLGDSFGPVRDAATDVLATLSKLAGERLMKGYLDGLDKIKQDKITAAIEKVELTGKKGDAGGGGGGGGGGSAPKAEAAKPAARASKAGPSKAASGKPPSRAPSGRPRPKSAAARAAKPDAASSSASSAPRASSAKPSRGGRGKASALPATIEDPKFPDMEEAAALEKAGEVLSAETMSGLQAEAWKERLAAVEQLLALVQGKDSLAAEEAMAIVKLGGLRTKKWKESNFQIMGKMFNVLAALADKAGQAYPDRCGAETITVLTEKLGDMKLNRHATETLLMYSEALTLNFVALRIAKVAAAHRSPKVLAEGVKFVDKGIVAFGMKVTIKPIVALIKKALQATNPAPRKAAIDILGTIHVYAGPSIKALFEDEKPALLSMIEDKFKAVASDKPEEATRTERSDTAPSAAADSEEGGSGGDGGAKPQKKKKGLPEEDSMDDLIPRVDIMDSLPGSTIANLGDKNWKVRGEGLDEVTATLKKCKRVNASLGDLSTALKLRLGDSNKNHVMTTCSILVTLAEALGSAGCKKNYQHFLSGLVSNLADAKEAVRTACTSALSAWQAKMGVAPFVESEAVCEAIKTGKPNAQRELLVWLADKFGEMDAEDLPGMKTLVKPVFSALGNRNADVRKAAQGAFVFVVVGVGADKLKRAIGEMPTASRPALMTALDNAKEAAPASGGSSGAAASKPAAKSSRPSTAKAAPRKSVAGSSRPSSGIARKSMKRPRTGGAARASSTSAGKSGQDASESGPHLLEHSGKAQRLKDERNLKVLKWNFTTPRQEFVDQLQDQSKGAFSKTLSDSLFADDFKKHVRALDILIEAVHGPEAPCGKQAIEALDVLLKWITLRFFDTNTTVLLKAVQFLQDLFATAVELEYELAEQEAACFIPYLINKYFRSITKIYPASKFFAYLLEGLKSKNARQRAECLIEISFLIERHGMAVCPVGAAKALKAIAKQISDRDNGVRSAALDAVVTAYNIVGEDVYKLMGNIGDKNTSLVAERIKRSAKTKPKPKKTEEAAAPADKAPAKRGIARKKSMREGAKAKSAPAAKPVSSVPQEFGLDLDSLILPSKIVLEVPELEPTNMDLLEGLGDAPSKASGDSSGSSDAAQPASASRPASAAKPSLPVEQVIVKIGSSDIATAIHALKIAEDMCKESAPPVFESINELLRAACQQLKLVFTVHMKSEGAQTTKSTEIVRLCKHLLSCIMHVFNSRSLAMAISTPVLKGLVQDLLTRLLDENLESIGDGPQVSRALNMILLKILENSDRNAVFRVLLDILCESVTAAAPPKFTELTMKCIWKLTKTLNNCIHTIKVDELLLNIHSFLGTHPPSAWKQRTDDTPLRTVKTILHTLSRLEGIKVLDQATLLGTSDITSTAVGSYLTLMLEKSGIDSDELAARVDKVNASIRANPRPSPKLPMASSAGPSPIPPATTNTSSRIPGADGKKARSQSVVEVEGTEAATLGSASEQPEALSAEDTAARLTAIFAKIQAKATTKQGIADLVTFRARHPGADLQPQLLGLSPFMQSYVKRHLKSEGPAASRPSSTRTSPSKADSASGAASSASSIPTGRGAAKPVSAASYLERLRALKAKTSATPEASEDTVPTLKASPVKRNPEQEFEALSTRREPLASKPVADNAPSQSSKLEHIKARLAKMKQQNKT